MNASRYGNLCTSAPSLAALGIAGTSSALLSLAQTVSQLLQNSCCRKSITFPIRKFLRSDVEGVESVGAVSAMLEQILLALGRFLAAFVLAETIAATAHAGCLNGKDKVIVILSVEERHKALRLYRPSYFGKFTVNGCMVEDLLVYAALTIPQRETIS